MATLSLVLDQRRSRKDGTFPLVFRLRIGKQFSDIKTEFKLKPEEFNLKTSSIVNDLESNEILVKLYALYLKRLREFISFHPGALNTKEAREYILNKRPEEITIFEFWESQIKDMCISGRHGGARTYKITLSVLSQETNLNRSFSSFSYKDLVAVEKSLFQRGVSINGISVYMRTFRAICNQAINMDLASHEWYPFRKYKLKKERTTPRVLNAEELKRYFNLDLDQKHPLFKSWTIGKLLFMLRGINLKDLLLLSPENIRNGRIIYKRAKTGKIYSIRLEPQILQELNKFEKYKTLLGLLGLSDLENQERLVKVLLQRCKVINAHLKKISDIIQTEECITTYVFRYTYANIAKQSGYSKDLISEALGHEYGNAVTGIYLEQFDLEEIDRMNVEIIENVKP
jgi:integrase/recombinase XerD